MSGPNPVGISAQDARVQYGPEATPQDMAEQTNAALALVRADLQRIAQQVLTKPAIWLGSGTSRMVATANGIADVWAKSDTATTGSTGANYHTLTLYRNGAAANTVTYRTDRTEVLTYKDGNYLGQATVGIGDVFSVNLATTGAPSALTLSNLSLLCKLTEQ